MDSFAEDSPDPQRSLANLPPFPRIWVGYALGIATFIAEMVTIYEHPEIFKEQFFIPPLYLFLAGFISLVYWLDLRL
jgi:hypothetical protein